jgi:hypothetical protein
VSIHCKGVFKFAALIVVALVLAACPASGFAEPPIAAASRALISPPFAGDARWIAAQSDAPAATTAAVLPLSVVDPIAAPAGLPIFRRSFTPRAKVVSATLDISGLGQFEAHINGHNVTEALLTPGWSDYRKRVYYDSVRCDEADCAGRERNRRAAGQWDVQRGVAGESLHKVSRLVRRAEADGCAGVAI